MITLLKSKLWFSNPFSSANVTNEDRRQIAGGSWQKLRVLRAQLSRRVSLAGANMRSYRKTAGTFQGKTSYSLPLYKIWQL